MYINWYCVMCNPFCYYICNFLTTCSFNKSYIIIVLFYLPILLFYQSFNLYLCGVSEISIEIAYCTQGISKHCFTFVPWSKNLEKNILQQNLKVIQTVTIQKVIICKVIVTSLRIHKSLFCLHSIVLASCFRAYSKSRYL